MDLPSDAASERQPNLTAVSQAFRLGGFSSDPVQTGGQTLVEGTTFAVCGPAGDILESNQGLFIRDTRMISRWRILVDGHPLEPLAGFTREPFASVHLARTPARNGQVEPTVLVERRRFIGDGLLECLLVHNFGTEAAGLALTVEVACDFADLFEVKRGRPSRRMAVDIHPADQQWEAKTGFGDTERAVRVVAPGAAVARETISYRVVVGPHQSWQTELGVTATIDGRELASRFPIGKPVETTGPVKEMVEWRQRSSTVTADSPVLTATVARSHDDLAALRLSDPRNPDLTVIAAGAPWFMALFGRDALLTSSMMLVLNPDLAAGTLRALARYQGQKVDPMTEEQPGRILHELRFGADEEFALGGSDIYYGSIDATPLFVVVLGQLACWGADAELVEELLGPADRALQWMERYGDSDGDGFIEYKRTSDRGLRNQGWKDSVDGINFADGRLAEPPIALLEVQAYAYRAFLARARLARWRRDAELAEHYEERASRLKARINRDFWLEERGYFAVGLDESKRPIDSLTSNIGHLLWAGAADPDKGALAARRLCSPEMFTGFGIRTLSSEMGAYNPASYHNGSVWPHDTAIAVAGLRRYGFVGEAQQVASGLIDAASYFAGRLPELFCGFDRRDLPGPVPYPTSCAPQAWASAAPVGMLTTLLGLEPDIPAGEIRVDPKLPPAWGNLRLAEIPIGDRHLTIEVRSDGAWSYRGSAAPWVVRAP